MGARITPKKILELPGEIRNLIYNYTVEEEPVVMDPPPIQAVRIYKPKFQGLCGVSKQISSEFLPKYRSETIFEVSILAIDDFLSCFFPNPGQKGNILIDCGRSGPHGSLSSVLHDERDINILPMLKFLADSPEVTYKFVSHLYSGIFSDRTSMKINDLTRRFEGCFLSYLSTAEGQKLSSIIFNTRLSFEFVFVHGTEMSYMTRICNIKQAISCAFVARAGLLSWKGEIYSHWYVDKPEDKDS